MCACKRITKNCQHKDVEAQLEEFSLSFSHVQEVFIQVFSKFVYRTQHVLMCPCLPWESITSTKFSVSLQKKGTYAK